MYISDSFNNHYFKEIFSSDSTKIWKYNVNHSLNNSSSSNHHMCSTLIMIPKTDINMDAILNQNKLESYHTEALLQKLFSQERDNQEKNNLRWIPLKGIIAHPQQHQQ